MRLLVGDCSYRRAAEKFESTAGARRTGMMQPTLWRKRGARATAPPLIGRSVAGLAVALVLALALALEDRALTQSTAPWSCPHPVPARRLYLSASGRSNHEAEVWVTHMLAQRHSIVRFTPQ